ncbi:hypothetical protein H8959_007286 [Pygathrix nigripes]
MRPTRLWPLLLVLGVFAAAAPASDPLSQLPTPQHPKIRLYNAEQVLSWEPVALSNSTRPVVYRVQFKYTDSEWFMTDVMSIGVNCTQITATECDFTAASPSAGFPMDFNVTLRLRAELGALHSAWVTMPWFQHYRNVIHLSRGQPCQMLLPCLAYAHTGHETYLDHDLDKLTLALESVMDMKEVYQVEDFCTCLVESHLLASELPPEEPEGLLGHTVDCLKASPSAWSMGVVAHTPGVAFKSASHLEPPLVDFFWLSKRKKPLTWAKTGCPHVLVSPSRLSPEPVFIVLFKTHFSTWYAETSLHQADLKGRPSFDVTLFPCVGSRLSQCPAHNAFATLCSLEEVLVGLVLHEESTATACKA